MKKSLLVTVPLLAIAGLALIWQARRIQELARANAELTTSAASLPALLEKMAQLQELDTDRQELVRLRSEQAQRKQELAKLRGQLGAVLRAATGTASPAANQPGNLGGSDSAQGSVVEAQNPLAASGSDSNNTATQFFVEAQLARAKERLNLSPEQEQNIRGLLTQALEKGREDLQKVLTGQARTDEVPTQEEWARKLEDQILVQLASEQQTVYQKYKREDIMASARLQANGELLLVQNLLGLTQEQQDQTFALLYSHAVNQMIADPAYVASRPREPLAAMEWGNEQKLKALESALTPQQLETYRKLQAAQTQLVKGAFRPKAAAPAKN